MDANAYVLLHEVRDEIAYYYNCRGETLDFRDAVLRLSLQGKIHNGQPTYPDFENWDLSCLSELKELSDQIPILLQEIIAVHPGYRECGREILLPAGSQVQISLEFPYAPDQFHILEDYFAIFYVMEGNGVLRLKNRQHRLQTGDFVILAPGIPHRMICSEQDRILNIISLTSYFEASFFGILEKSPLMNTFFHRALYTSSGEYLLFSVPVTKSVRHLIQHLYIEFLSRDLYATDAFLRYLQLLYIEVLHSPAPEMYRGAESQDSPAYTVFPTILQYIQKHYRTLNLSSLAQQFHYNPSYLSRLIRQNTGRTLTQILTDLRLEDAISLLSDTTLSIGQVSEMSGYHSADHFAAAFRKKYGQSPTAFRRVSANKSQPGNCIEKASGQGSPNTASPPLTHTPGTPPSQIHRNSSAPSSPSSAGNGKERYADNTPGPTKAPVGSPSVPD